VREATVGDEDGGGEEAEGDDGPVRGARAAHGGAGRCRSVVAASATEAWPGTAAAAGREGEVAGWPYRYSSLGSCGHGSVEASRGLRLRARRRGEGSARCAR
jgi:hypothetical protein